MIEDHYDRCANVTLAFLAGGQSRRMGMPKAHLQINNIPVLKFLYQRLAWPGPTLLVTAPGREKPPAHELFHTEVVDPVADQGPLRGTLTALEQTRTPALVLIPIDMPGLTFHVLSSLVSSLQTQNTCSLAMIEREGQLEPLPAAFDVRQARFIVKEQMEFGNSSLHELPGVMKTVFVQAQPSWPKTLWVNLNHPADVEDYLQSIRIGAVS